MWYVSRVSGRRYVRKTSSISPGSLAMASWGMSGSTGNASSMAGLLRSLRRARAGDSTGPKGLRFVLADLAIVELAAPPAPGRDVAIPPPLDDAAPFQNQDMIGFGRRLEVVGDHEAGLSDHETLQSLTHLRLALDIQT